MAKISSNMLDLNTKAPDFNLTNVFDNSKISFYNENQTYTASVVMFICNHCPYVKHILDAIIKLVDDYKNMDIRFFAINSNDISSYPDDSPENMKKLAVNFPYMFDETQQTAKDYKAACTPDFYIFNKNDLLVYRGQFDDSRPGNNITPNGISIRESLNCLLEDKKIPEDMQKPSIGCSIKWKR